jgi:hypothetical protein
MQFVGIRSEGGLLSLEVLQDIAEEELEGQKAAAFGLPAGRRLTDEIARAWSDAQAYWKVFTGRWDDLPEKDSFGTTLTRERWVTRLLQDLLGYELAYQPSAAIVNGKGYAISHRAGSGEQAPPVHIEGFKTDLDKRPESRRLSPQALLQEYLNNIEDHLWGIVTNGIQFRLLRDTSRTSRPSYLEFHLQSILEGNNFNEFALFYRLCHRTRLPKEGEDASKCLLEKYFQTGIEQGGRVRDHLRDGVELALKILGSGFLQHPRNRELQERARSGALTPQEYHRQLLRLVYRLLFLMVAEERRLVLPDEPESQRRWRIYVQNYSVHRLRLLAERHVEKSNFADLWIALKKTFQLFQDGDSNPLGIPPLNGDLFSSLAMRDLDGTHLYNDCLLEAMRNLSIFREGRNLQRINYSGLDVEELGSVYESLLDFQPVFVNQEAGLKFDLRTGSERKSTGSYYTRPELVRELIESALVPVMEDRLAQAKRAGSPRLLSGDRSEPSGVGQSKEGGSPRLQAGDKSVSKGRALAPEVAAQIEAILSMSVCDPACGSGHFLLAAARRLGRELAKIKTGEEEPTPKEFHLAVREVISHCIYGVDLNPLAVDLCKLALWLEGHWTGKPLSFLDHRIKCGNSLIGVLDPKVLEEGIPDDAFKPVTGDDKEVAKAFKKRNRDERRGQPSLPFDTARHVHDYATEYHKLAEIAEETPSAVRAKASAYQTWRGRKNWWHDWTACNIWTAAFFAPLTKFDDPTVSTHERFLRFVQRQDSQSQMAANANDLANRLRFFHWRLEFPEVFEHGGFDVVLGNPPWERIKLEEEQHWNDDSYIAKAKNKAERQRRITEYRSSADSVKLARLARFDLAKHAADAESKFLRNSTRFQFGAVGDINTYALFAETSDTLTCRLGMVGLVLPTGLITDDTYKDYFVDLLRRKRLVSAIGFVNSRKIFPAVKDYIKFALYTLGIYETAHFSFLLTDPTEIRDSRRRYTLSSSDLMLLNPNTRTCPVFRTTADAELTKSLYSRTPVLRAGNGSSPSWGLTFMAMFHMANDSGLFQDKPAPGLISFYEAKMFHQYDHRYSTYQNATASNIAEGNLPLVSESQHADINFTVESRYWVAGSEVQARLANFNANRWLLSFRDVTGNTAERTVIFSVLPLAGVGHPAPLVFLGKSASALHVCCFLGNMNSLVLDYVARQKVAGAHLTYGILEQLPILPPESFTDADEDFIVPRVLELVFTSADIASFAEDVLNAAGGRLHRHLESLALVDGNLRPFCWKEERRAQVRAELDAWFAHRYSLCRDELRYILDPCDALGAEFPSETFRLLRDREIKRVGEYRTRRLVLEAFDKLAESERFKDEMPKRISAFEVPKRANVAAEGRN